MATAVGVSWATRWMGSKNQSRSRKCGKGNVWVWLEAKALSVLAWAVGACRAASSSTLPELSSSVQVLAHRLADSIQNKQDSFCFVIEIFWSL